MKCVNFRSNIDGKPAFGLKILRNKYAERCFFSANWPDLAHHWLPTVDHPYDKATGEFIVTAPSHYQVVANGVLEEETRSAGRPPRHPLESASSDRDVALQYRRRAIRIPPFRHGGRYPVGNMGLPAGPRRRNRARSKTPAGSAVEFFSSHIGPYPYEKLADVEAAGFQRGDGARQRDLLRRERP